MARGFIILATLLACIQRSVAADIDTTDPFVYNYYYNYVVRDIEGNLIWSRTTSFSRSSSFDYGTLTTHYVYPRYGIDSWEGGGVYPRGEDPDAVSWWAAVSCNGSLSSLDVYTGLGCDVKPDQPPVIVRKWRRLIPLVNCVESGGNDETYYNSVNLQSGGWQTLTFGVPFGYQCDWYWITQ